ncbi:MAG: phenylalanine--tRNA ligase subunit beta [Alphaproteobacteria bacterium]|nr:phenylalanine--tRNA ligase subunit beta [Alphaproteobacteria bacterium]
MKFTLNWLKRHLDTRASLAEICETLTAIGLEVESVQDRAATYAPFAVALVETAEKHPQADRLKLCTVRTKDAVFQVVCGAPNARAGMKAVFAPEGSYIPGLDVVLKKTAIRGVESCGMLVSEKEMCLSDESEGIIDLDPKWEIGTPMAQIFGLDDPVIEINLTPNRADCAGVRGIARDLAAAGVGTLKPLALGNIKAGIKSPISVTIEDNEGCKLFLGRYIKGVKNGPSPEWLQKLLKDVGQKSISALVDITNFMTFDHARPLHVYDADKIKGPITVRRSKGTESLVALNDKTYEKIADAVGIYDDSGMIGLGGIIGGASTGCSMETVNVFVEAAYFNPTMIAQAGRALQIHSDARYRFERGVDPAFVGTGLDIATQLILEICGGQASDVVQAGDAPSAQRQISFNPEYTRQLLGYDIAADRQHKILHELGFTRQNNDYTVPSWRGDVQGRADLVEEIVRIDGFDKIPAQSLARAALHEAPDQPTLFTAAAKARLALAAQGLQECVTWSFTSAPIAQQFGLSSAQQEALTLANPIASDLNVMRPSILPNLLEASARNAALGYPDSALFEVGPVFFGPAPEDQKIVAAGLRSGAAGPRHWANAQNTRDLDAFDAKADVLAVLEVLGAPTGGLQLGKATPPYYHPGRSGALMLGKAVLAYFGEIHPARVAAFDIRGRAAGFEIFLDALPAQRRKSGSAKALLQLEPLQPLHRDFAFIVGADVAATDLIRAAQNADKDLIKSADIFDVYTGAGVPEGQKSVALSVVLQPHEKSLTEAEIEALSQKIITQVVQKTGGTLRS